MSCAPTCILRPVRVVSDRGHRQPPRPTHRYHPDLRLSWDFQMRVREHVCDLLRAAQYHAPRSTREKHFPVRAQRRTAHLWFACFSKRGYLRVIASLSGCIALAPCECGVAQQVAYCCVRKSHAGCHASKKCCNWATPRRQMRPTGTFIGTGDHQSRSFSQVLALSLGGNVHPSFSNSGHQMEATPKGLGCLTLPSLASMPQSNMYV
jgi:hypothetical protein